MRLDYALYILAAILLIITAVPFVAPLGVETTETRSVWVVATVVLGLLSIGAGYSQRPKTEAQACQSVPPIAQETVPETQPVTTVEAPKERTETPLEKATMEKMPMVAASATTIDLTQVKGIGEKRATQLKALGISSVDDLSKASAEALAKELKISPKMANKWIDNAKELVK